MTYNFKQRKTLGYLISLCLLLGYLTNTVAASHGPFERFKKTYFHKKTSENSMNPIFISQKPFYRNVMRYGLLFVPPLAYATYQKYRKQKTSAIVEDIRRENETEIKRGKPVSLNSREQPEADTGNRSERTHIETNYRALTLRHPKPNFVNFCSKGLPPSGNGQGALPPRTA